MNKQTIARALLQPDKNFPIDCETIDALQKNVAIVQILGNIVGDRAILLGCELEPGGVKRRPGYVFLRTRDYPEGEVIFWEGGPFKGGVTLHQENVRVTTKDAATGQEYDFPQAYTVRSLRPGVGNENFLWDFRVYKTPGALDAEIAALRAELERLAPPPLGIVEMWAGSRVPAGYVLCEGQQLKTTEYPELYAALGDTFNRAVDYSGKAQTTTSGYFRLPDLRGRFVVGYSTSESEYNAYGKAGGEKKHKLTTAEMPSHAHSNNDYYYIENSQSVGKVLSGRETVSPVTGSAGTDGDNNTLLYKTHDTASAGYGYEHENRPPFYTLAYIMKTKN